MEVACRKQIHQSVLILPFRVISVAFAWKKRIAHSLQVIHTEIKHITLVRPILIS
jgi:hypothetical protein